MSLVISITHPKAIIMASDTKIITTYKECNAIDGGLTGKVEIEQSEQIKTFIIPQIGCLSFWGEATNTRKEIEHFIENIVDHKDDIDSVSDKLFKYLKDTIKPNNDIGFHLGGFNKAGAGKLYHIFYSVQLGEEEKGIGFYKNLEDDGGRYLILFNGKNQHTGEVMLLLRELQTRGYLISPSKHSISDNESLAIALINHTARIIEKYDGLQSVGGNIKTFIIEPNNVVIRNSYPCEGEVQTGPGVSGDSVYGESSLSPDPEYLKS